MIVSVACFGIGSYILIDSGFKDSLEREISSAYAEIDLLRYSLNEELKNISGTSQYLPHERTGNDVLTKDELIMSVASSIAVYSHESELSFSLSNANGKIIYNHFNKNIVSQAISKLPADSKGHEITLAGGKYYIHSMVPISVGEYVFFIENFRDVSEIFASRNSQYAKYVYIIMAI